jgi:sugar phosphate isomerase/epimerase
MSSNRRQFIGFAAASAAFLSSRVGPLRAEANGADSSWRVGLHTHSYHELNLRRLLPRLGKLGLGAVELSDSHVSPFASDLDVARARQGFAGFGVEPVGMFTGQFGHSEAADRRIFEVAAALGLGYLSAYPEESQLPSLLALSEAHGVRLAILNGEVYASPEAVQGLLDRHPGLMTVVDVGHYARAGFAPDAVAAGFLRQDRLVAVHAKDMTTTEGPESADPYTVLGTGVIDWPAIAAALRAGRYRGYLLLQYTGDFWNYLEREPKIAQSLDFLRSVSA